MTPKLSVLMPAKRTDRWLGLWESINNSFSGDWELRIGTSMEVPPEILEKPNVFVTNSHRSPLHKQQQLLCEAKGEYVTAISDDTLFQPNAFNRTSTWKVRKSGLSHSMAQMQGHIYSMTCNRLWMAGMTINTHGTLPLDTGQTTISCDLTNIIFAKPIILPT